MHQMVLVGQTDPGYFTPKEYLVAEANTLSDISTCPST